MFQTSVRETKVISTPGLTPHVIGVFVVCCYAPRARDHGTSSHQAVMHRRLGVGNVGLTAQTRWCGTRSVVQIILIRTL